MAFNIGGPGGGGTRSSPLAKGIAGTGIQKGIPFPPGQLQVLPRPSGAPVPAPVPAPATLGAPAPVQPPSALDAQYQLNAGAETKTVNNQIAGLNQAGGYAATDLQTALAKLAQQRPVDERNLMNRENAQGLLYSGNYGQQEGLLGQSYGDRQAGLQQNFDRGQTGRASQIAGLNDILSNYLAQQRFDATGRASTAAQNNPALGVAPAPAAPAPAAAVTRPGGVGTDAGSVLSQKLAGLGQGRKTIRAPQQFGKAFR